MVGGGETSIGDRVISGGIRNEKEGSGMTGIVRVSVSVIETEHIEMNGVDQRQEPPMLDGHTFITHLYPVKPLRAGEAKKRRKASKYREIS
jgi:hypothetical protein